MAQNFQDKFKGQIQTMGKSGIAGTMNMGASNNQYGAMNNNFNMPMPGAVATVNQVNPVPHSNDPLSNWNQIYNNEQKGKGNKKNTKGIPHTQNRIINNGQLIMKTNNNTTTSNNIPTNENEKRNNYNNMNPIMNQYQPPQMYPQNMLSMPQYPNMPMYPYQPQPILGVGMNIMNQYQPPQNNMMNQYQANSIQPQYNPIRQEPSKETISKQVLPKVQPIEYKRASSSNERGYSRFVEYKPYTLKDYKELTRTGIVMGPLGANIGTKEWENKKAKMKRMENYSNRINQTHKGITKLKKDTPKDEIEKTLKKKYEESHRYRTYEYGKLIRGVKRRDTDSISSRSNVNLGNDYYYKDLGVINEDEEIKVKDKINLDANIINNVNSELNDDNNFVPLVKETKKNMDLPSPSTNENILSPTSNFLSGNTSQLPMKVETSNTVNPDLEKLLQQREAYKAKINDIKESLL